MHNWKNVVLKQTDTIQTSIKILNQEALRIIIVIDKSDELIGTVTDGDIRRGLIKNLSLDMCISKIMSVNPITAHVKDSRESVLSKMKEMDLLQIPIVDEDNKIVGLEILQHLLTNSMCDNPVLLMAGGFGRRLHPLTKNIPKPLLKIGLKPILENILDKLISAGFHNFYISTHYKAEMIRKYFGDGSKWGVTIEYIHEKKPLGTAGSLGLLPKKSIKLPILVMNGDLLTKVNFKELLNFHNKEGRDATMCVREYSFQVPYGVVNTDAHIVESIEEKPVYNLFVNTGIYVLNPSMLENIDGSNCIDMPQLLEHKIKLGRVTTFPMHEYWLDIGQIDQFEKAQQDLDGFLSD